MMPNNTKKNYQVHDTNHWHRLNRHARHFWRCERQNSGSLQTPLAGKGSSLPMMATGTYITGPASPPFLAVRIVHNSLQNRISKTPISTYITGKGAGTRADRSTSETICGL
jgi:hypothetical protein